MIIAHKETERYSNVKDEQEFVHVTILKFKVKDIDEKKLMEFYDIELIDNDSEENYFEYGISNGWDGELFCIDIDRFINGLKKWVESEQEEEPDEDDQSYYMDTAKELIKGLEKYIDYDFYFEEVKQEAMQSEARHSSQA